MGAPMHSFVYESLPSRVIFGSGTRARLAEEIDRLGLRRVLVLSTPPQRADAEQLAASLGTRAAAVFAEAAMHTPVDVTERAMAQVTALKVDGTVAVGGGSTTGLGKAIALRSDLPQLVMPTTYAGSEMTPILGETQDGRKTTQRSAKVLPEVVIYDVELTLTLPPALSSTSGMNAIAHAVEALYSPDRNPIVSLMADDGIASLGRALPKIIQDPADRSARSDALYGAWLCGCCLGAVGMALHHKLCHTLGGTFDLPHAETHTIVLPHAIAYNARRCAGGHVAHRPRARNAGCRDRACTISRAVSAQSARCAISACRSTASNSPPTLPSQSPYPNPRPITRAAIRDLISRAWAGVPPQG